MQWCVTFPEESVFVVRPSLIALCMGQRSAAKLLSVLLYRCSLHAEAQSFPESGGQYASHVQQEEVCTFSRTQTQLVADLCGELSEKTLHKVAIPTLQLLGYLDLDDTGVVHRYTVYLERIRTALVAYRQGPEQFTQVLLRNVQREKCCLNESWENLLLDPKKFQSIVEKVLIRTRTFSTVKNRRQPRSEAGSSTLFDAPKNQREIQERRGEKMAEVLLSQQRFSSETDKSPARNNADITALSIQLTNLPSSTSSPDQREVSASARRQTGGTSGTRRAEGVPHLTPRGQQVLAWYEAIRQVKVRSTAENIRASNGLGEMEEVTRENLEAVITLLDHDPWLQARNLVVDLQELECPRSKFRFERVLLAVKQRRGRAAHQQPSPGASLSPTVLTSLPDYTHTRPEDLYIRA